MRVGVATMSLDDCAPRAQFSGATLTLFSTLLARLHSLDPQAALGEGADAGTALDAELARVTRALDELDVPELSPVVDWLRQERPRVAPRGPSVIHQDYHPKNVLLGDDGRLHVIDWTIARVADPRSDLALTLVMLAQGGFPQLRAPIEEAYTEASGSPLADMPFFDVMACLKSFAGRFAVLDDAQHKRPALWARVSRRPAWDAQLASLRGNVAPLRSTYETIRDHTCRGIPAVEALLAELDAAAPTER